MKAILQDVYYVLLRPSVGLAVGFVVGVSASLVGWYSTVGWRTHWVDVAQMRCPEDSDVVVRYYAGPGSDPPAGEVAFCLSSDSVEEALP